MTRKLAGVVLFVILVAAGVMAQTAAQPAGSTATKIGIINMQAAVMATNEGQRDLGALQAKFQPRQNELEKLKAEIDDLNKQLQNEKLAGETRNTLARSLEQKQKIFQRNLEDAKADYEAQTNEVGGRIYVKVLEVLNKYATDNGYSVVIDISNQATPVLWAAQANDITKTIVDTYNTVSKVPPPPATAGTKPPAAAGTRPPAAAPKPAATTPKPTTSTPKKP